jgi:hypothetical protein
MPAAVVGATTGDTAQVRPRDAGAKPVQLTLTLRRELQCGRLRGSSVLVVLPRAFSLPRRIAPDAVAVRGAAPAGVSVSRATHAVRIALQPPHGIICDSIAPGSVAIVFAKAAALGNPAKPGSYDVSVTAGHEQTVASITIR